MSKVVLTFAAREDLKEIISITLGNSSAASGKKKNNSRGCIFSCSSNIFFLTDVFLNIKV